MSRKISSKIPVRGLVQNLLILLLLACGIISLPQLALSQEGGDPQKALQSKIQVWKQHQDEAATFQRQQTRRKQGARKVVFSGEKHLEVLTKDFPFLKDQMQSVKDFLDKDPGAPQPPMRIAQIQDSASGANIFFLSIADYSFCSSFTAKGCSVYVYLDEGTGYKKSLSLLVPGLDIYFSNVDDQASLFIPELGNKNVEWLLKDHGFVRNNPPKEPESQAYVEWLRSQNPAGSAPH